MPRSGDNRSMSERNRDSELARQNFQAKTLSRMMDAAQGVGQNPEFARGFGNALQNTNKFGLLADFGRGLADYGAVGSSRNNTLFGERVPANKKFETETDTERGKAAAGLAAAKYGYDAQYDSAKARADIDRENKIWERDYKERQLQGKQGLSDDKIADIALKQFEAQLPGKDRQSFEDIYKNTAKTFKPQAPPPLMSDPSITQPAASTYRPQVGPDGLLPNQASSSASTYRPQVGPDGLLPNQASSSASTYRPQVGPDGLLPNQASSSASAYRPPIGQAGGQASETQGLGRTEVIPLSQMTAADKQNAIDYGGVSPSALKPVAQGVYGQQYGPGDQGTIKSFPGISRAASMPDQRVIQGVGENIYMSKLPDGTPFYKNAGAFARDGQALPDQQMAPAPVVPPITEAARMQWSAPSQALPTPATPPGPFVQSFNNTAVGRGIQELQDTAKQPRTPYNPPGIGFLGENGVPTGPIAEAVTSGTKPTQALVDWAKITAKKLDKLSSRNMQRMPQKKIPGLTDYIQGLNDPTTSTNPLFPNYAQ